MQEITKKIPPKAKQIMEFGCETGNIAREFKSIQPKAKYGGTECNPQKAALARQYMDFVIKKFASAVDPTLFGEGDVCIYHSQSVDFSLFDKILQRDLAYLREGGCIIFELENTSYFRNVFSIWQGKSPESRSLWSLDDMIHFFETHGLQIDGVTPVYEEKDAVERDSEAMKGLINAFVDYCKEKKLSVKTDMWAKKYIIRAFKLKHRPRSLIMQTVVGEPHACARVRIHDPHAFCRTLPAVTTDDRDLTANLDLHRYYEDKVLIRQRMTMLEPHNLDEFTQALDLGYVLIYEIDDNPLLWRERYERLQFADFRCCHAVQVSTEPLAAFMRQFNTNVVVFKNQLTYLPEPRIYKDEDRVNVFFGAVNRERDWRAIMPVINRIIKKYNGRVHFKVMYDEGFYSALETDDKEFFGGFSPYKVYEEILRSSDIALLPLENTEFNKMKSDLKFIECAGHGVAVLASPTVYEETIRDGRTGFIYRNKKEFEERLSLLIEDRNRRFEMVNAAYNYVKEERLLADHYQERVTYYKSLLERRIEIAESIKAKIAEIKAAIKNK